MILSPFFRRKPLEKWDNSREWDDLFSLLWGKKTWKNGIIPASTWLWGDSLSKTELSRTRASLELLPEEASIPGEARRTGMHRAGPALPWVPSRPSGAADWDGTAPPTPFSHLAQDWGRPEFLVPGWEQILGKVLQGAGVHSSFF